MSVPVPFHCAGDVLLPRAAPTDQVQVIDLRTADWLLAVMADEHRSHLIAGRLDAAKCAAGRMALLILAQTHQDRWLRAYRPTQRSL